MAGAVTFDFHNTLVRCDSWFELEVRHLPGAVARRLREIGLLDEIPGDDAIEAAYRDLRRQIIDHGNELDAPDGVIETFRRVGLRVDRATVHLIVADLFDCLVATSTLVDGARETIEFLASQDVRLGVISSAVHHPFLEKSLEHHGVRHHFAAVVTSASCGFYKSRPEIYQAAYAELGASLMDSVHVGDSFRFDHLGGRAAGLRTVWLNPERSAGSARDPNPELELNTLVGAGPVLLSLLTMAAHAR